MLTDGLSPLYARPYAGTVPTSGTKGCGNGLYNENNEWSRTLESISNFQSSLCLLLCCGICRLSDDQVCDPVVKMVACIVSEWVYQFMYARYGRTNKFLCNPKNNAHSSMYYPTRSVYPMTFFRCDSAFIHLPWILPPMEILFWTTDWIIQNGPPLHHIYILN